MTEARKRGFWRHARPIAAVSALVAVGAISGCADEEELPADTGNGGSAGTGTGGGASGKGGSGGTAGTAGKGGSAGTGGAGGGGTGGGGSSGKGGAGGGGTGGGGSSGKGGAGGGGTGGGGSSGKGGAGGGGTGGGGAGGGGTGGGGTGGGGTGGGTSCPVVTGDGTLATKTKLADGGTTFVSPFDAVPSPDGSTVYFTAIDVASGKGAVYSVPAAGGAVTTIAVGMVAPTGIAVSGDGKTLYVADEAGAEDAADFTKDAGLFYTVGTAANSTPTVAVKGGRPHSVTVAHDGSCKDVVYVGTYSGDTPTISTFAAGAFTTAVTTKFEASGIAAAADGTLYWVETVGGPWASIQTAKAGGAGTLVTAGLYVGYPAGLALSPDGKNLVLSALAPADGTDSLVKLDTAGKTLTQQQPATDKTSVEAAGMHRALDANVFAFVDGLGSTGTGAVYLVKPLGRGLSWRIRNEDCKLRIGRARGAGCDRYRGDGERLEPP